MCVCMCRILSYVDLLLQICDQDNDGVMNDREIYQFQVSLNVYATLSWMVHCELYSICVSGLEACTGMWMV